MAMVRFPDKLHAELKARAEREGTTLADVVEKLFRADQERQFWMDVDAAYARLQADPVLWEQELEERRAWEATLLDDLEDDPWDDSHVNPPEDA